MTNEPSVTIPKGKILKSVEIIKFPEFNADAKIEAKIDTGAFTGSLHCTNIHLVETKDGPELHFAPFDHPEIKMKTKDFRTGVVRSSNGEDQERYFIRTIIVIAGQTLPITLSLADRTEMRRDVLIGRRFLADHGFLVDVGGLTK